ncbi:MAG: VCBS repeat-containing protein [Kiritimatiellae bacterium]|nr:VCBS repeat-containing protein [Kiritimatiellia bacterium]
MSQIKVRYDTLWMLAGAVEERRNGGVAIPAAVDAIVQDALVKVNFESYMRDEFPARRAEVLRMLESLDGPGSGAGAYEPPAQDLYADPPRLPPLETRGFFTANVLNVGLKAYPYVVDFNGDGRPDLLVGDHDGFIYVFLNEGTAAEPRFGPGARLRAADTGDPFIVRLNPKIAMGDLTGSGSLDLVLGTYEGRVAFVRNRAEPGRFSFAVRDLDFLRTRDGYIDVRQYAYPELVDWNGDGLLDVVVGNIEGKLILFRNLGGSGGPVFSDGEEVPGIERLMYPYPVFADWDNDGRNELILGHRDGTVIVYANAGTDSEPRYARQDVARHADGRPVDVGLLSHPCVADLTGSGRKDLLVGNDPGQVILFRNIGTNGRPVFDEGRRLTAPGAELIAGVHSVFTFADFRGTGVPDLVVGHEEARLRIFPNAGEPGAPAFDQFDYVPGVEVSRERLAASDPATAPFWDLAGLAFNTEYLGNLAPCAVDWRNTGTLDLLVGHYTGLVYWFENAGTRDKPRFAPGVALRAGGRPLRVAGFATPVVCDWNNDGRKDLVVGDLLGRVRVFLNTGADDAPEFEAGCAVTVAGRPLALGPRAIVEVADLDGDGKKDLIVGNRLGDVYALLNTGTDAEPRFDAVERVRDKSALWRRLYAGMQHVASWKGLYDRLPSPGQPKPMNVVETACPRVADLNGAGRPELLVSQRYGRVFRYGTVPHPPAPPRTEREGAR